MIDGVPDEASTYSIAIAAEDPPQRVLRCTGTLIAPRVVLTVRHCIEQVPHDTVDCTRDVFTGVPRARSFWITADANADRSTRWRHVARTITPRQAAVCGDDVALLVLEEPVPAAEANPAEVVTTHAGFETETSARVFGGFGYGATSPDGTGTGIRRGRFDLPIRCVRDDPSYSCVPYLDTSVTGELVGGGGPCSGDSGMAALTEPRRIVAVLARSTAAPDRCADGVYERADRWGWFVADAVIDVSTKSGDPVPAWATAAFNGTYCHSDVECEAGSRCQASDGERSRACVRTTDPAPPAARASGCSTSSQSAGSSGALLAALAWVATRCRKAGVRRGE
jgi:hypothetical protein